MKDLLMRFCHLEVLLNLTDFAPSFMTWTTTLKEGLTYTLTSTVYTKYFNFVTFNDISILYNAWMFHIFEVLWKRGLSQ
jgi:hypothetical protein